MSKYVSSNYIAYLGQTVIQASLEYEYSKIIKIIIIVEKNNNNRTKKFIKVFFE